MPLIFSLAACKYFTGAAQGMDQGRPQITMPARPARAISSRGCNLNFSSAIKTANMIRLSVRLKKSAGLERKACKETVFSLNRAISAIKTAAVIIRPVTAGRTP